MYKSLPLLAAALLLGACATAPQPLRGDFTEVSLQDAARHDGTRVRWGGEIIATEPAASSTCIYALAFPLSAEARPRLDKDSPGRFVACRSGFYDPEIFAKGRQITVVGRLDGSVSAKVGAYDYRYPRIAADTIHLWPPLRPVRSGPRYDPLLYDPFWGPAWRSPWWYQPAPVIIVPQPAPQPQGPSGS